MSRARGRWWTPPPCSSGKASFRNQGRALNALVRLRAEHAGSAVPPTALPLGAYRCRECGAWHLTRRTDLPGTVLPPPGRVRGDPSTN